ncbi:MAG: hypothetical protein MRJ68_08565 [Nitrospira sp.]|nr:hypothetical protein [Nitrospira sp.]
MSIDPLLRLKGDTHERLQVAKTERGAIAPGAGLIFEWARKGRREERALLADILPDRGLDVPTSQRGRRSSRLRRKQEAEAKEDYAAGMRKW